MHTREVWDQVAGDAVPPDEELVDRLDRESESTEWAGRRRPATGAAPVPPAAAPNAHSRSQGRPPCAGRRQHRAFTLPTTRA